MALLALLPALTITLFISPPARGGQAATIDPDRAAVAPLATPPAEAGAFRLGPATAFGVTGAPDVIGGDDEVVLTHGYLTTSRRHAIAIASDGTLFVAMSFNNGVTGSIGVYRSTDAGNTWHTWGGLSGVAGSYCDQPAIRVAEGDQDRVYVAYRYRATDAADGVIRVAWSPLGAAAAWTNITVLSQAGVTFALPSLDSDAISYSSYVLYLAAAGQDGDGMDVWFSRSSTFGATWAAEYRIATMSIATRDYYMPEIKYGWGGTVHCVFQFACHDGGADDAIRYRRALNRAANGTADWQSTVYLTSNADGRIEFLPSVAAAYGNMWTVIAYGTRRPDGVLHGTGLWASPDAGATWGAAYEDSLPGVYFAGIKALPGIEGFVGVAQTGFGEIGVMRSRNSLPLSWTAVRNFNDRLYDDGWSDTRMQSFDYDPMHGNLVAAVWPFCAGGPGPDTLYFDAEWHRDPGWPNYEAGMPKALPSPAVSAPAICELDGDAQSEIVYADAAGNVQVLNHDGTSVPGWPQSAGAVPTDSPVAVGDLDGDGHNEVVVGNSNGWVYAWHRDGTPLAGWPVNLILAADAKGFVSLGALLPDSPLQVVVTCGMFEWVLLPSGAVAPGWPSHKVTPILAPAAIGDLDADGTNEIVVTFGPYMNIHAPDGTNEHYRNLIPEEKTFAGGPSLADLDLDGFLEIVAPTAQGDIYAYRWDGADQPGFPWHDPTAFTLTSAALANIWSMFEPEIAFGTLDADRPHLHLLDHHGASIGSWPRLTDAGGLPAAPIVDVVTLGPSSHLWSVFATSDDGNVYGWENVGDPVPGWPKDLYAPSLLSPASGDIDADGNLEMVLLTSTPAQLHVVDLGAEVYRHPAMPRSWWPMYGYNHERQSCLACGPSAITWTPPAGSDVPARLRLEPPWPNPAHGSLSLRFALPAHCTVRLEAYDVGGRLVRELLRAELPAGVHELAWDGRDAAGGPVAAGVYYVRLAVASPAGEETQVRRVALMR